MSRPTIVKALVQATLTTDSRTKYEVFLFDNDAENEHAFVFGHTFFIGERAQKFADMQLGKPSHQLPWDLWNLVHKSSLQNG